MAHRITLLALEGCFASNITGAVDLFNTANIVARRLEREPPFEWQVLSLDGRPVRASSGYQMTVDGALENAPPAKVVMIPAFGSPQPVHYGMERGFPQTQAHLEHCTFFGPCRRAKIKVSH